MGHSPQSNKLFCEPYLRTVLSVLLVVGVKVVDGIIHDVLRVHCLLQVIGDALHGDHVASAGSRATRAQRTQVDRVRESDAQCNRCKEHLNANDEVLPAGGHGTGTQFVGARASVHSLEKKMFLF